MAARQRNSRSRCAKRAFVRGACAVLLLCCAATGRAQISPGALSRAHSSISGATQCAQCHGVGVGAAKLKCLDCHTEIRERIAAGRGYHARILPKEATGKDCVPCHSEHNGAEFQLMRWDPSLQQFDHSKTGYPLEGKHAGLDCKKCHTAERISAAERRALANKDLNRTYLGLSRDCVSCHTDEHHGQLSKDCQKCHTVSGWKPASKFNHGTAKYALTGAHERVACQKCHTSVAAEKPYVKYTGIAFQNCMPCHADPHKGAFQNTCQTCHTTATWKQVRAQGNFDHSKTRYPLLGRHLTVACEKCHRGADFQKTLPFANCADCHAPDPHRGQFQGRKLGGECGECHDVNGYKPSLFTVAMHAATNYPLEGQHEKVACGKCHLPKAAETLFKITATQCAACHADVHKGQFAGPPHNNRCEGCHTVQTFHSVKFTLAQHNETRFPLTGAHAAVPCNDCHKTETSSGGVRLIKYRFEDRTCTACHQDPHQGQFAERMAKKRADGSGAGCEACHNLANWHEISGFDHSTTAFPLLGAHRAASCSACHHPPNLQTSMRNVQFKGAPTKCEDCHEDPHAGQFEKGKMVTSCGTCHNEARWRPSVFDHERQTTFSLAGAHQDVPCADCHKGARQVNGRRVVFYKPTPKECNACHS
jgi:hypothetical protein